MKFALLMAIFVFGHLCAVSQPVDQASRIEQVQTVVGSLVSERKKAEFLLNDFYVLKGSVIMLTEHAFSVESKNEDGKKITAKVLYEDVLAISGKNIAVSFVPDPDLRAFGKWQDVLKLDYNRNLEVVLEDGRSIFGRLNEKTIDKITLVSMPGETKITLPRSQIVSAYRVWRENPDVREGAARGSKKGKDVGAGLGNPFAAAFGIGIGAIIGAIVTAARKESELRVLIYSK
jgi:hypothetical protein